MALSDYINKGVVKPKSATVARPQSGGLSSYLKQTSTPVKSGDLKTASGLRTLAEQSGLQKQLERIPERGEKPKKIYSGGFISDTFDTLNALQYGVAGVIKGKGFKEGVRDRESFTDVDALGGKGTLPFITGIALDIATDPLTYVGGLGLVSKIGKFTGASKLASKAADIAAKTRTGEFLGKQLIYRFGQDPIYKEMAERTVRNKEMATMNVVELSKPLQELDGAVQREITRARELGQLGAKKAAPKIERPFGDVLPEKPIADGLDMTRRADQDLYDDLTRDDLITKAQQALKYQQVPNGKSGQVDLVLEGKLKDLATFLTKAEKGSDNASDMMRAADTLTSLAGATKKIRPVVNLTTDQFKKADAVFSKLDEMSQTFAGLMFKPGSKMYNTYMENVGTYMRRTYREIEKANGRPQAFLGSKQRSDATLLKMRKDLPDEVRESLDEIREAGYPTAKVMVKLTRSIENLKFFKNVADTGFASDVAQQGMKRLPDTPNLGALKGKYVPEPIWDDLNDIIRPPKTGLDKALGTVVGAFKYGKVILNPATHARNMMSNLVLNNFEGLSPARIDIYTQAAHQVKTKGKWYKEAQRYGLGLDSFAANEINTWLDDAGGVFSKAGGKAKEYAQKIANIYQKEEEWAKMAQYIYQRKKGLPGEEAWKIAERATFNYAQVTPFIRKMRESILGYPFITFTYKVTPQVVKTLINKPTKISNIGKIKQGIENQIYAGSTETTRQDLERSRASEPDWIRNGFYMTLPFKDDEGRVQYLDLTYLLPFGDLVSGNFFEAPISRETGFSQGPVAGAASKLAFVQLARELVNNQDFYGNKVWKDSDPAAQKYADMFRHISRTMAPPMVAELIPGGYRADGTRRPGTYAATAGFERGSEQGGAQTRNLSQELLRTVGLKINPIDIDMQEGYADLQEKEAIKTILGEAGVTGEFGITYQKDEEDETTNK